MRPREGRPFTRQLRHYLADDEWRVTRRFPHHDKGGVEAVRWIGSCGSAFLLDEDHRGRLEVCCSAADFLRGRPARWPGAESS